MITVTVLYPNAEGARFDHDYYRATHMPMVERLWAPMGMTGARVMRGVAGPDGKPPPYVVMTHLTWADMAAVTAAMRAHGAAIFKDIRNFTDIAAQIQASEG